MVQENEDERRNAEASYRSLEFCYFVWEISNFRLSNPYISNSTISPFFEMEKSPVEWYLEMNMRRFEETAFSIRLCRSVHDSGPREIRVRFSLELKLHEDVVLCNSHFMFNFAKGTSCGGDFLTIIATDLPEEINLTDNYKLSIICKMVAVVESEIRMLRKPDMGPSVKYLIRNVNAILIVNRVNVPVNREFLSARSSVFKKMFLNCGNRLEIPFYSLEVVLAALRFLHYGISWLAIDPAPIELYQFAKEYNIENLIQLLTHQRKTVCCAYLQDPFSQNS